MHLTHSALRSLLPCRFKRGFVLLRVKVRQKVAVGLDGFGDEVLDGGGKDRASLCVVGVEQLIARPTLQHSSKFPA